jgi:tetratricopeptide (TPR) repeat protein
MEALKEYCDKLEKTDLPAALVEQARFFALGDNVWIAFHAGTPEQLTEAFALYEPVLHSFLAAFDTEGARQEEQAYRHFWDGLIALKSGDLATATAAAEMNRQAALAINESAHSLDDYHFLKGLIALQGDDPEQAIQYFSEVPDYLEVYGEYWLAKAYEAAGRLEEAQAIYETLVNHNFNSVDYALIRNELLAKVSPSS